jgi:hypothetical protein
LNTTSEFELQKPETEDDVNVIRTAIGANADILEALLGALVPVGGQLPYCGTTDPAGGHFLLTEGRLIDRATPAGASFYAVAGHAYNGGIDPGANKVRLPNKRGRTSVGADNMGTALGAAGVLTTGAGHDNARGQHDGAQTVTLTAAESGVNGSGSTTSSGAGTTGDPDDVDHSHDFQAVALTGGSGTEAFQGLGSVNRTDGGVHAGSPIETHKHPIAAHVHPLTARTADSAHENMPPYEVDNWIVRVL